MGIPSRRFNSLRVVWALIAAVLSVKSCLQPFQLLSTPGREAANEYTKVDDRLNTKSQVRPILQSPRSFLEVEVTAGCLHPLEIECHADPQIND